MNAATDRTWEPPCDRPRLAEELCLALIITAAFLAVPTWFASILRYLSPDTVGTAAAYSTWCDLFSLLFGLILVAGSWRRSGLRFGSVRRHWRGVLLVCGIPIVATAVVYPLLPERPFADAPMTMWLVSPLAQDLVFSGYLYGRFGLVSDSYVHPRVRIRLALVLAAVFFSLHHLPGLLSLSVGYVAFQLTYTFLGLLLVGLSRQWTGSLFYITATHMAVNLIAYVAN
ncbi:MAG: CPBP family intramembrane metalloprotease [Planctomycetes bacterium]|nr:CPBP family intramembrane metalloprotease [Planctomycetota bacterium]